MKIVRCDMIKNIVLDVGGVIFNDEKECLKGLEGRDIARILKLAYSGEFKGRLLGTQTLEGHLESLRGDPDFDILEFLINEENLPITYPVMPECLEYVRKLKADGYKLYLLTNITEGSHKYIDSVMDIDSLFDGGIYSYQDGVKKPNQEIYQLLIDRFGLKKEETIFFDDKEKNVKAAREFGIQAEVFKTPDDITRALERDAQASEKQ
ncbi:MAG: HAD family phosphatase [Clostridiales bacterium]|nr:HAD family phosphatase [Clostridiales bacterium]